MVDFHHTALDVQLTSVANYWGGGFLLNTVMLVRARGRVCVYICRVWVCLGKRERREGRERRERQID